MNDNDANQDLLPAKAAPDFPDTLPLLFIRDQVVFPMSLVPIRITTDNEIQLIEETARGNRFLALLTARDADAPEISLDNAYEVGCIARIYEWQHLEEGGINVLMQVLKRFKVAGLVQRKPYYVIKIDPIDDVAVSAETLAPLATTVKQQMHRLIGLSPNIPDGARTVVDSIDEPGFLADLVAGNLGASVEERQDLLETRNPRERLEKLTHLLERQIQVLEASQKIRDEVKSNIDKGQREYYLRQQMRAIQEELGEGAGDKSETEQYREQIEALDAPEEVRKEALRELDRLERMHEQSAEYHVIVTYLDTIIELPWGHVTEDYLDIEHAAGILDEDHYGLDKVKKRILEYLAVRKLKPDAPGPILCFLGPPGVGKTSLGQSIARTLGRQFCRMSLGGIRDEAEIRGHRKTYVGALPGRIIQNIRRAGSMNPVFMLDEIDKLGADFRGDPSSAMLEVLDPAQNNSFVDNYLNVPFDLSKVMFIGTANMSDTIPWALRDRMEIIDIPGYTQEEKLEIARRYLVPRQREAHGLLAKQFTLHKTALRKIIASYTREAGVRNLEREIANVCRGCARKFAEGRQKPIKISSDDLREYLGPQRVFQDVVDRTRVPGVAVGLAWTPTGGDILFIEATRMTGKGNLTITGQLGDVMKESATAAMSYLRANAQALSLEGTNFSEYDVHVHVPAGAVPKDGPSAGVALMTALASLFMGKRVKNRVAMTGEITLRGLVLPVGGIKEKVLAASRSRVKEVILPERNKNDLEDVPPSVREKLTFHFPAEMHEVLRIALGLKLKV
ncbi:MAG: endopeptidase La [Candidatus Hydrogenedentota bacterium]